MKKDNTPQSSILIKEGLLCVLCAAGITASDQDGQIVTITGM